MSATTAQIVLPCGVITNHPGATDGSIKWTASAERVGNDVLLIHNSIPHLSNIVELADAHSDLFESSSVVGEDLQEYADPDIRKSDYIRLGGDGCPDGLLLYDLLLRSVEGGFVSTYLNHVNTSAVVHVGSGYGLFRYHEGGYFREHVDVTRDHPILGHRRLSIVVFCNDDFVGGNLVFPRQDLTIKPETGLMVMFPSGITHPHEVEPVSSGARYSIVGWFF